MVLIRLNARGMKLGHSFSGVLALLLACSPVMGGEREAARPTPNLDPWTGEGVSLGGILFPQLSYQMAAGTSTTDPASLAVGRHDPNDYGVTQQALDFSLEARLGDHLKLFANYSAWVDRDHHWQDEFDEYYAKLRDLPLGLQLKGGRFFTQFGYENSERTGQWDFVDKNLAPGRFVGESAATIYGGEISLPIFARAERSSWRDRLSFSYGSVADTDPVSNARSLAGARYDGDRAHWQNGLGTVDYTVVHAPSDAVRVSGGVSGAWGENDFGRQTELYGAHFEYLWRAAGAEARGEFFRWRTEAFVRHFGAEGSVNEEIKQTALVPGVQATRKNELFFAGLRLFGGTLVPIFKTRTVVVSPAVPPRKVTTTSVVPRTIRDDFTDTGLSTAATYGFPGGHFQAHLRGEYVSGLADTGLPERYRLSPAITWHPCAKLPVDFKLQYNYDHFSSGGDEHSVWAQFSLVWGRADSPL